MYILLHIAVIAKNNPRIFTMNLEIWFFAKNNQWKNSALFMIQWKNESKLLSHTQKQGTYLKIYKLSRSKFHLFFSNQFFFRLIKTIWQCFPLDPSEVFHSKIEWKNNIYYKKPIHGAKHLIVDFWECHFFLVKIGLLT